MTFLVTNYWEHLDADKEMRQVERLADAVRGVEHVVWSTLEDYRRNPKANQVTSIGKWKVPHFDAKGACDHLFFRENTTFLRAAFYLDNFMKMMAPMKNEDGTFTWAAPMGDKKLPMVAKEDIGRAAWAAMEDPQQYRGKYMGVSTCVETCQDAMATMSKVLGVTVKYYDMDRDAYANLGFPGAEDVANMFYFHQIDNENFVRCRTE